MTDHASRPLRDVIEHHQLRAKKGLGQHFLLDRNLTDRIARTVDNLSDYPVIEVGPGPGGLTRSILSEGAECVIAIERDPRCVRALQDLIQAHTDKLTVVETDALKCDELELLQQFGHSSMRANVISNLPYNIGSQLLVKWMAVPRWPPWWNSLTLLFQKEVAERITARPGTKEYGRLSVLTQSRAKPRLLFDIPARAFTPPPKVVSSLVQIVPSEPVVSDLNIEQLGKVTAAAFGQRRKMLRRSLRTIIREPEALLNQIGIDPTCRAEDLSEIDFCRLTSSYCDELKRMRKSNKDTKLFEDTTEAENDR